MTIIDHEEIRSLLPHRYPFLLVDKVIAFVEHEKLTAVKNITANEPYFSGHFPTKPVMPGVLMIEALAQASGVLIFKSIGYKPGAAPLFYLAGINNTRFKRMVVPGDQLILDVEVIGNKMNLWKFKGIAAVDGEICCSTEFMCMRGGDDD